MSSTIDHLRSIPLFQGLTERSLEAASILAREKWFEDGDILIAQGAEAREFLIITEGQVTISRDGRPVRELGPGEFIGEIALVDRTPTTASAVASGPVSALSLDRDAFRDLIDRAGSVRLGVLMALTERVQRDERDEAG